MIDYLTFLVTKRGELIEDFSKHHMTGLLPDKLRVNIENPKYRRRIMEWLFDNGYHYHYEGNWIHLVQGVCVVGEKPKCNRIASLYIEHK